MVIVSTLVVYPLILIINALLGPLLNRLPFFLGLLISMIILSGLMTYPVMPWVTRALGFWLYHRQLKRVKRGCISDHLLGTEAQLTRPMQRTAQAGLFVRWCCS